MLKASESHAQNEAARSIEVFDNHQTCQSPKQLLITAICYDTVVARIKNYYKHEIVWWPSGRLFSA